jgi:hypothetical protein
LYLSKGDQQIGTFFTEPALLSNSCVEEENSFTTFAYQFSAWLDWLTPPPPPPGIPTSDYEFIIYPKCTVRKIVIFSRSRRIQLYFPVLAVYQRKESKNRYGQVLLCSLHPRFQGMVYETYLLIDRTVHTE